VNITVVGAAGRLGQRVVEEASRRGHQVTGLARHPQRMAKPELLSRIAAGDGRDRDIASGAVAGADAVVITVAGGTGKDPHQAADVTRAVAAAMREHGVHRLVITSAYPIVGTRPRAAMWALRKVLATPYADVAQAEQIATGSGLDWTIARLNRLTDQPPAGPPHVSTGLLDRATGLSRADAAALLVDLAETRDHARQALNIRGRDQVG
jgi:nucleoside-diphosphate-sugar epimerase